MRWLTWSKLDRHRDLGLLVLRVGMGLSFVAHGWPKLTGGMERWTGLGGAMKSVGITFAPAFFGFAASLAEVLGGLMVALGLGTRPASAFLAFTMFIAFKMHLDGGDPFMKYSHSMEAMIVFVGLTLLGGGRYALDARLR